MKKTPLFLIVILAAALFLRVFRTADLLGFYYDQGRDGLVIWDLIHHGKVFLIGPTTGIEGIFLGPFYYYLIAPFYALGHGNPVFPAIELAVINVLAIALLYYIGRLYFDRATGLLSAVLVTFSASLVSAHRWLSNPTPLPLFALLVLLALIKIIHGHPRWWLVLGLCAGLSLQLEAASAVFFLPAIAVVTVINLRHAKFSFSHFLSAVVLFGATLLPQIYFDFRHDHLLLKAFQRFLLSEKSFQPGVISFFTTRLNFYFDSFSRTLFITHTAAVIGFIILAFLLVKFFPRLPRRPFVVLLIWWLTPLVILLFYHGNHGYVWGYYFTGVYPVFILIVSALGVTAFRRSVLLRPVILILLAVSLFQNFRQINADLFHPDPSVIPLTASTQAVDWAYRDSAGVDFNVDVYVPPQIPYAYDYLVLWRGATVFKRQPQTSLVTRLYTIYEPDPERPQYLAAWLARQDSYGPVSAAQKYGGVTVQRRNRISLP